MCSMVPCSMIWIMVHQVNHMKNGPLDCQVRAVPRASQGEFGIIVYPTLASSLPNADHLDPFGSLFHVFFLLPRGLSWSGLFGRTSERGASPLNASSFRSVLLFASRDRGSVSDLSCTRMDYTIPTGCGNSNRSNGWFVFGMHHESKTHVSDALTSPRFWVVLP